MSLIDELANITPDPVFARKKAIHKELAEMKTIATFWTTCDVRFYRPELTEEQAWQVLEYCKKKDPGGYRMSFRAINSAGNKLFGPQFRSRAKLCEKVLKSYGEYPSSEQPMEEALVNFLADAMHWCRTNRCDFHQLLHRAQSHFFEE
jgi:hypothetical protein